MRSYVPNQGQMPLLEQKNDLNIKISGAIIGNKNENFSTNFIEKNIITNFNTEINYSPIQYLGLNMSYFHSRESYLNNNVSAGGKIHVGDFSIGTYKKINSKKNNDVLLEFYAGGGIGLVHNYYAQGGWLDARFSKIFFQPNLHLFLKKHTTLSVGYRNSLLLYQSLISFNDLPRDEAEHFNEIVHQRPYVLHEFIVRAAIRYKYGDFFITSSSIMNSNEEMGRSDSFFLGTTLQLNTLLKKNKE